jgi:hypothetical protein
VLSGPNYLELSGLQGNRRYDFWVKAETSKGYGPASDITSIILARTGKQANIIGHGGQKLNIKVLVLDKRLVVGPVDLKMQANLSKKIMCLLLP